MEDSARHKDNADRDEDTTPRTKQQSNKQKRKTNKQPDESTKKKENGWKSLRRGWKASGPTRKLEIIIAALVAAGAVGYLIAYIVVSVRQERIIYNQHAPLVIHSRPPRFLQPLICDPNRSGGGLTYGNMEMFVKNIKGDTAERVFPFSSEMKVIPGHKTGDRFWDDLPLGRCDFIPKTSPLMFSLVPGEEKSVQARQGVLSLPPLKKGDTVQLYRVDCVYYSDHEGTQHAACDSYRFSVPSDDPLDRTFGTPNFSCDATPKVGAFTPTIGGSCAK